tara:strand:- start:676 stop:897 length:222 start_codon:yes stop_codon:yes gene_type:complete
VNQSDVRKFYSIALYFYHYVFFIKSIDFKKSIMPKYSADFYVYANMKRITEDELGEVKELTWKNYPTNFIIFF